MYIDLFYMYNNSVNHIIVVTLVDPQQQIGTGMLFQAAQNICSFEILFQFQICVVLDVNNDKTVSDSLLNNCDCKVFDSLINTNVLL